MTVSLKPMIIASTLGLCLSLSGCGSLIKVHRLDVQQGNIISKDQLAKIHKGMSQAQVMTIIGNPVLTNVFETGELDYVYTWKPGYGKFTKSRITVRFRHNKMIGYTYK